MYKLLNYSEASAGVKEFVADSEADLYDIKDCEMGSICLIIDTKKLFIKNSDGEWKPWN